MLSIENMRNKLEATKARSAWMKGLKLYADDLLDEYEEARAWNDDRDAENVREFRDMCLNGAQDWQQYSEGGGSLIYDKDIAERLCNPTELKITDHGRKEPNKRENWIDVQARALLQAFNLLAEIFISEKENAE